MRLGFFLFNYFPYGGLQRDFLRIAEICHARGHEIHVFCLKWQGDRPSWINLHIVATNAWQNHTQALQFANAIAELLKLHAIDRSIGFNKLPHLDFYYAADVCYQARIKELKPWYYPLLPRYRVWRELEASVFSVTAATEILLIAPTQQAIYTKFYHTPKTRFHLLPPGISRDRIAPANAPEIRHKLRQQFQIDDNQKVLLLIASAFKTKGLDRALQALAQVKHDSVLWVIGADAAQPYHNLIRRLDLTAKVKFFGPQQEILPYLLAADVLIHPAYHENTGTVLLEALTAGLPVLTTANCGYAPYITQAQAGIVIDHPFRQQALNESLNALLGQNLEQLKHNALTFTQQADIYAMPEKAANIILAGRSL